MNDAEPHCNHILRSAHQLCGKDNASECYPICEGRYFKLLVLEIIEELIVDISCTTTLLSGSLVQAKHHIQNTTSVPVSYAYYVGCAHGNQ